MSVITLRFIGICCVVEGREKDQFVKRAILPADRHGAHRNDGPHIPYVEIEASDLPKDEAVNASKTFTRGAHPLTRTYHRFDLAGERVSIRNAGQGNGRLIEIPTFGERVPRMTLVCPDCPPNPRAECFDPAPPRDLVAAYFDMRSGYLSAGPVENDVTTFEEGSKWPPRRLAQWAQLDVTFQGDHAEVLIEKFDGSSSRTIPLARDAAVVTFGNQLEVDIEETSAKSTDRSAHFDMYYDIGQDLPAIRPKPSKSKGGLRACAPITWP